MGQARNRTKFSRSARWAGGFTLVELVTVTAVVAFVAVMAAPRYADAINRSRADAAARRVAADLNAARIASRTTSQSQVVRFDSASASYSVLLQADASISVNPLQIISLAQEPYNAVIESADFTTTTSGATGGTSGGGSATSHQVGFDRYGWPTGGGTVVIRAGDSRRSVVVDANTGKAGVQ